MMDSSYGKTRVDVPWAVSAKLTPHQGAATFLRIGLGLANSGFAPPQYPQLEVSQ